MANSIDTRSPFFPNAKSTQQSKEINAKSAQALKRNSIDRFEQINQSTSGDAKVQIPDAVRDFSRIKKAVDAAPEVDNSAKIAQLKQQIASGQYSVDYDALADRMLQSEF